MQVTNCRTTTFLGLFTEVYMYKLNFGTDHVIPNFSIEMSYIYTLFIIITTTTTDDETEALTSCVHVNDWQCCLCISPD